MSSDRLSRQKPEAANDGRRRIPWLAILATWTALGLLFVAENYVQSLSTAYEFNWRQTLSYTLGNYWAWALITPSICFLAIRFPIEERRRWRHLGLLIAISLISAPLQRALSLLLFPLGMWVLGAPLPDPLYYVKGAALLSGAVGGVLVWWCVWFVYLGFDYYGRYRRQQLRSTRLEAELAKAELKALKMQLHPHFLFNTLHNISALMEEDLEGAQDMIARLSDLLRIVLESSGAQRVTLAQEIDFLRAYLEIEQIRFQDDLETSIRVSPDVLDLQVPNFVLQPLVENSIRHGVGKIKGRGRIEISASRENGYLAMRVTDNGPGPDDSAVPGVGLTNTRRRLDQIYGPSHQFRLYRAAEGGGVAEVRLPIRPEDIG